MSLSSIISQMREGSLPAPMLPTAPTIGTPIAMETIPDEMRIRQLWAGLDHSGTWPDLMSPEPTPGDIQNILTDVANRGWPSVEQWFAAHSPRGDANPMSLRIGNPLVATAAPNSLSLAGGPPSNAFLGPLGGIVGGLIGGALGTVVGMPATGAALGSALGGGGGKSNVVGNIGAGIVTSGFGSGPGGNPLGGFLGLPFGPGAGPGGALPTLMGGTPNPPDIPGTTRIWVTNNAGVTTAAEVIDHTGKIVGMWRWSKSRKQWIWHVGRGGRHMNVMNARALSRANRRVLGFASRARGVMRSLGFQVSTTRKTHAVGKKGRRK